MPRQNKILIRQGTTAPSPGDFDTAEPAWDATNGKFYIKNSAGSMVEIGASSGTAPLTSSDIGVTVQGYDADTAKLDVAQTFTAAQTFADNVTLNAQSDLRFADSDSSNWVAFQAPATVASNVTWTLPAADGTSGQVLGTDGSGTLSWTTPSAGGVSLGLVIALS